MSSSPNVSGTDEASNSSWTPYADADVYNGKVLLVDDSAAWVIKRFHRGSGWCVETRVERPDGDLVRRQWAPSGAAAQQIVDDARRELGSGTLDPAGKIEVPPARGVLVAHGFRWQRVGSTTANVDGTPSCRVCTTFWLPPGQQTVRFLGGANPSQACVTIEQSGVTHVCCRSIGTPVESVPRWHVCRRRNLAFNDGIIVGDLVLL